MNNEISPQISDTLQVQQILYIHLGMDYFEKINQKHFDRLFYPISNMHMPLLSDKDLKIDTKRKIKCN